MKKIILVLILISLSGVVWADSERCPGGIVSTGDSLDRVLDKCGQPIRSYNLVNGYGVIVGQKLIYDFGGTRFLRHFIFRGGRLYSIREESR